MQRFRKTYTRSFLTSIMGFVFLNMGFFLFEVKLLGIESNRQLTENISKIIAGTGFEEERDCSSSSNPSEEEYFGSVHATDPAAIFFLISANGGCFFYDGTCLKGYLKTISPPPEI